MGSGDDMSVIGKLTNLANSFRSYFNMEGKLGLDDMSMKLTNLLPNETMPPLIYSTYDGSKVLSDKNGEAQRFRLPLNTNEITAQDGHAPINIIPKSGEHLSEAFVIKTDGNLSSLSISFFTYGHHMVPCVITKVGSDTYEAHASYVFNENPSVPLRCFDLVRFNITGGTYIEFSKPYIGHMTFSD